MPPSGRSSDRSAPVERRCPRAGACAACQRAAHERGVLLLGGHPPLDAVTEGAARAASSRRRSRSSASGSRLARWSGPGQRAVAREVLLEDGRAEGDGAEGRRQPGVWSDQPTGYAVQPRPGAGWPAGCTPRPAPGRPRRSGRGRAPARPRRPRRPPRPRRLGAHAGRHEQGHAEAEPARAGRAGSSARPS